MSDSVSVVIPTYNYGRFLGEAIESVLAQTCKPAEVIVVDDGSTDETATVVESFSERGVRYIRQENAGVCAARNRGVAESTGELIAFLDADDTWDATKLEKQIARFAADPEVGLVHCGTCVFDGATGATLQLQIEGAEDGVVEDLLLWQKPGMPGPGGTIMVPKSTFTKVGGFDIRMKCGEDWDFCYRVARVAKVAFVAEPLVNYRSHAAAAHNDVEAMERGMSLFYEKAFDTDDPAILALKRRSYSNFHRVMAGSYFNSGRYSKFVFHTIKSLLNSPSNLLYFAQFPLRKLR
jgi:glycosyltransferase involved in cell wall biosynthesis